jgi:ABC-type multidrug transport system ATPase subunit
VKPDHGRVHFNGINIFSKQFSSTDKLIGKYFSKNDVLGYCPEKNVLFDVLTVGEHLDFYSILKGISKSERLILKAKILEKLKLKEHENKRAIKLR